MSEHVITSTRVGAYTVYDYSPRALFVTGDTKPIMLILKGLGGKFNKLEVDKGTGVHLAGWVFSKKAQDKLLPVLLGEVPETRSASPSPIMSQVQKLLESLNGNTELCMQRHGNQVLIYGPSADVVLEVDRYNGAKVLLYVEVQEQTSLYLLQLP